MDLDPEVLDGPGGSGWTWTLRFWMDLDPEVLDGPGCCFKLCDCVFCPVGLKVFIITAQCF